MNHFLGHPYDAIYPCIVNGSYFDYFKCVDNCLTNKTMEYFNRKPFHTFHTEPDDSKLISDSMITNETVQEFLAHWSKRCHIACPIQPCMYSYCITSGHSKTTKVIVGSSEISFIRIESPPHPNIYIDYVPKLPFLDFFIFIFSSLGTWFGLVIISCNPVLLFKKLPFSIKSLILKREKEKEKNPRSKRKNMILNRMRMKSNFYTRYQYL